MGVLSLWDMMSCYIAMNVGAAVFLIWVLHFVKETAKVVIRNEAAFNTSTGLLSRDKSLCPCLLGRFTLLQVTMGCTITSVGFLLLCAILRISQAIVDMVVCSDCGRGDKLPLAELVFIGLYYVCLSIGYPLMFVTHFERLRMTFSGTSLRLPKWAPTAMYVVLFLSLFLLALLFAFRYKHPTISHVAMIVFIVGYFATDIVLIGAFFKKTKAIAKMTQHSAVTANSALMEMAVRITLGFSVALLSTTVTLSVWAITENLCPHCLLWILLRNALLTFDMCLNAFCLMCAFRRAEPYYKRVFGKLHKLVVALAVGSQTESELLASLMVNCSNAENATDLHLPSTNQNSDDISSR